MKSRKVSDSKNRKEQKSSLQSKKYATVAIVAVLFIIIAMIAGIGGSSSDGSNSISSNYTNQTTVAENTLESAEKVDRGIHAVDEEIAEAEEIQTNAIVVNNPSEEDEDDLDAAIQPENDSDQSPEPEMESIDAIINTDKPEEPVGEKAIAITNVNVREQPNTSCTVLGMLTAGTEIIRYEALDDGWSLVLYGDRNAYVKSEYLLTESEYDAYVKREMEAASVAANTDSGTNISGGGSVNEAPVNRNIPAETNGSYIVNANTRKIHHSYCSHLPKESNRIYFNTLEEVHNAGYWDNCSYCMP